MVKPSPSSEHSLDQFTNPEKGDTSTRVPCILNKHSAQVFKVDDAIDSLFQDSKREDCECCVGKRPQKFPDFPDKCIN